MVKNKKTKKKLIKRIVKITSFIVYTVLLVGIVLWLSFSSSEGVNYETGTIYQPERFTSQINEKDATVFVNEDGTFSARVEYQNGNLKKIISVNWR